MKLYEIAYITDPSISPKDADSLQERISSVITKGGGVVQKSGSPQRKTLAYSVKKNKEAYFSSLEFSLEEDKVKEIEEEVKKEKNILRHLLVKNPKIKETERRSEKKKSLKPEKAKLQEIDKKIEEIV